MKETRQLQDLVSVGKATIRDLELLGITRVEQLKGRNAHAMIVKLEQIKRTRLDPCCEDVFTAAIQQAEHPRLPEEKKRWFYWSRVRKGG